MNTRLISNYAENFEEEENFLKSLLFLELELRTKYQEYIEDIGLASSISRFNTNISNNFYNKNAEANDVVTGAQNEAPSQMYADLKELIISLIDSKCNWVIMWSKYLPEMRMFSLEDQSNSIEQNFLEVILIEILWRSIELNNQQHQQAESSMLNESTYSNNTAASISVRDDVKFYFSDEFILTKNLFEELKMTQIYDYLVMLITKMKHLQLKKEEFICLKLLAMFKSDYGFLNVEKLCQLRHKCLSLLKSCTGVYNTNSLSSNSQNEYRYDCILMLLSDIKAISLRFSHTLVRL
jgi:hypothetical protein